MRGPSVTPGLDECDELGTSAAQRLAAGPVLRSARDWPFDHVLVDGNWDFVSGDAVPADAVRKIVKGDATCLSIAAALIVAKVTRSS